MVAFPTTTALTCALLGLLQVALTFLVIRVRQGQQISLGDGGDTSLFKRIRMHGNLTENAPMFLLLLVLLELGGSSPGLVRIIGPLFVLIRLSHAYGVSEWSSEGGNPFRLVGAGGTLVCLAVLSVALLSRVL